MAIKHFKTAEFDAAVAAAPQQNIKKRPPCGLFFITFCR